MLKKIVIISLLTSFYSISALELQYQRHEEKSDFNVLRKNRVLPKPYFFAQIQSYRLVENYLHYWLDRPLFHDSSLRVGQSYRDSFLRNVEILKDYEIDGFTTLSNSSLFGMYKGHLQALDEGMPYPGFTYMMGAMYAADYNPVKPDDKWLESFLKSYDMAQKSPYTLRINGKIPIWAYNSKSFTLHELKELSKVLRNKCTVEPILFSELNDAELQTLYFKNGSLNNIQIAQLRKMAENLLNECGGLIIKPIANVADPMGDYTGKPSVCGYYRNCLLPLLTELLETPPYRGKMIGAYVSKGYINHLSGNNAGEYGTHRFRLAMDELLLLNPDVVVFFEWNEANENTHFQPTVNDAKTMQRLVKFYARKMRGQPPAPNPGDNLSIPNLVFSSRQVLRLGDTLRYELLNIPDSDSTAEYRVQLALRDYNGNILKVFPAETFKIAEMKAVSVEIPSEQLVGHPLILPELRVVGTDGHERTFPMQYNRIHPSVCWNYKEIMQPLRDMLPLQAEFHVEAGATPGLHQVTAKVKSPEPLLQLEVTDNESEVFAVDREKRYDPEHNIIIQGSLTASSTSTRNVVFEMLNAPGWQWFRDCYRYKQDTPDPQVIDNKVTVPDYFINYYYAYPFIITVPKNTVPDAILTINIAKLGKHSFKVSELLKLGKTARAFDGNNRLDLNIVKNLVDIPVPLLREQAEFKTELETESRFPVYQLRAIGSSGRIYRSRPFMPVLPGGKTVRHHVFSATKRQSVEVEVTADRIPELNYLFNDARGAMLKNSWEPFFDAQLGGGFTYLEPFNRPRPNLLAIPGRKFLHPAWKDAENGGKVLEFDGMANYINLPREALPYGSFTLEFEIKPDGNDSQVLFRNFSTHCGSLNLYRRQGKLEASYTHRPSGVEKFQTELPLPEGKWSKVTVSYNLEELKFTVNGEVRHYPFSGRGMFFKPSVFGGHVIPVHETGQNARFFKGQLKSLRIRHLAE